MGKRCEWTRKINSKRKWQKLYPVLVLSIKYENDKWKLEIRPALAGLKLRN
jgi:hypothetical protein